MSEEDFDYGFSMHNEEVLDISEIEDLKERLRKVQAIFLPLLDNLARDPDKPMIKWPNRLEVIEKQKKELLKLTKIT